MKTGRRIVSKTEYVRIQTIQLVSAALCFLPVTCLLLSNGKISAPALLLLTYPIIIFAKRAKSLGKVIPLTRANTADLPATESLVRASQEPTKEDQSILLRPAVEIQHTPADQLLRPAEQMEAFAVSQQVDVSTVDDPALLNSL